MVDAASFSIQTGIDPVAFAIQSVRESLFPVFPGAVRNSIEAVIDPVALAIQMIFNPIPFPVQAPFNPVAFAIEMVFDPLTGVIFIGKPRNCG